MRIFRKRSVHIHAVQERIRDELLKSIQTLYDAAWELPLDSMPDAWLLRQKVLNARTEAITLLLSCEKQRQVSGKAAE